MNTRTLNIILFTNRIGGIRSLEINPLRATLIAGVMTVMLSGALLYCGYRTGIAVQTDRQLGVISDLQMLSRKQQGEIARARETARTTLDALTLRLGRLQAEMLRLDALGSRLVTQADLDAAEFDFNLPPPVGGPHDTTVWPPASIVDFLGMLDELDATAEDRAAKLAALEQLLMHRDLKSRVLPSGRAVEHGLLSSKFGMRIDPFTGKRARHRGIDIAAKEGSGIMAVGDGVVIWSGERRGYGNLVEVDHGNGYLTRYGHNSKLLVKAGDTVSKGQTIALMGSTGRSTGPHVHIEVLHNGDPLNPADYLNDL